MTATAERKKEIPTFEQIREMFRETDRIMKEMSREADQRKKEAARTMRDLKQTVKEVSRQLGGMANSDGDAAEEHFATSLASKMTFVGQHYDAIDFNVKRKVRNLQERYRPYPCLLAGA